MSATAEQFECPNCHGMGETRGPELGMPWYQCQFCKGEGTVTEAEAHDWSISDDWTGV